MGRLVLVSMLGRGPLDTQGGATAGRPLGYRRARYRFADGTEFETPLFAHALWHFLDASGSTPDAVVLVGTAGSMWDALLEAVPEATLDEATLEEALRLQGKVQANAVEPADVAPGTGLFGQVVFAGTYRPCLIDACETVAAQQAFCDQLMAAIAPGDRIVLDLTHGYRHLPMLAAFLLTSMKWLMDVEIDAVYYGGLELAREHGGVAPVINLAHAPALAQRGALMASYRTTGRYRAMAELFPTMANDIVQADYFASINQHQQARSTTDRLRRGMVKLTPEDGWCAQAASALGEEWRWVEGQGLANRMLECARRSLEQRQYFHAVSMLYEVFMRHGAKLEWGAPSDHLNEEEVEKVRDVIWDRLGEEGFNAYDDLRQLRNMLAHHGPPRKFKPMLDDEEKLRGHLEKTARTAERFLAMG